MSEPKVYELRLKPVYKSRARLLKVFSTSSFIDGQQFEIFFHFENSGGEIFPGCQFTWGIDWPSGQTVLERFDIPKLEKKDTWNSKPYITDALSGGFGLIFIKSMPRIEGGLIQFRVGEKVFGSYESLEESIGSVNTRRSEEIYAVWGLLISAFGLVVVALDKIIAFLQWLVTNWN